MLIALLFTAVFFCGVYAYQYHNIFRVGYIPTLGKYFHTLIYQAFSYQGGRMYLYNASVIHILQDVRDSTIPILKASFVFFVCSFFAILGYFKFVANRKFKDKLLHGFDLVSPKILTRLVHKHNAIEEKRIVKSIKKRNRLRIKKQNQLYKLILKYFSYQKQLKLTINISQYVWNREKAHHNKYLNERRKLCNNRLFMIKFKRIFASENRKILLSRGILVSNYLYTIKAIKSLKQELLLNKIPLELEYVKDKYSLGGIPMPIGAENTHILSIGTTGTGKTVSMNGVIATIKNHKGKAVIYDKMGTFVEKFYNPKTDIILNPFDMRSPAWSIFKEVEKHTDWDMIA